MRRSWIAVGAITLVLGIVAGYRLGRSSGPDTPGQRPAVPPVAVEAQGAAPSPADQLAPQAHATDTGDKARPSDQQERNTPDGSPRPTERRWGVSIEELTKTPLTPPSTAGATGSPGTARPLPSDSNPGRGASGNAQAPGSPQQGNKTPPPAIVPAVAPRTYPPVPSASPQQDPGKPTSTQTPADDPNSDRHPPVLQYLRFDPPEIQDGASAVLSVGVTDDLSGVKSVFGTIRSPSEAAVIPFVGQDAGGTGVFAASITIPKKAETGNWFVGTLQIIDKADNPLNVAYLKSTVPPGGALHVVSPDSDSTAPTVHGVTVDKQNVGGGETNRVVVAVDDDHSGVASVTGSFQSASKAAYITFSCTASGEGTWAAQFTLPQKADCGEWTLRQLRVADKANNSAVLLADSPELGHVSFTVASGGGCDSDPPILDQVIVAPAVVSNANNTEVTLTITAHDDGSGIAQLTGHVDGPAVAGGQVPRIYFASQPDARNPDAPMVTRITVPVKAAAGIWRVASIELTDKARNMRTFSSADPVLVNATITVE